MVLLRAALHTKLHVFRCVCLRRLSISGDSKMLDGTAPGTRRPPPTGVDVLGRQVLELPFGLAIELDEHQVPDLQHIGVVWGRG